MGSYKATTLLLVRSKDLELCYSKEADVVKLYGSQILTELEIWMIEVQLLATVFFCRRQGQQLVEAPRSNQLKPYLPVRMLARKWQKRFKRLFLMEWAWWMTDEKSSWRTTRAASRCARILWCRSKGSILMWSTTSFENEWKMRQSNSSFAPLSSSKLTCWQSPEQG